ISPWGSRGAAPGGGGGGGASILSDAFANRPAAAAGNDGTLFFPTDAPGLYRSNGSAWRQYGEMAPFNPVNPADWAWDGGTPVNFNFYSLYDQCWIYANGGGFAAESIVGKYRARVGDPDNGSSGNYICCLHPTFSPGAGPMYAGIAIRASAEGKIVSLGIGQDTAGIRRIFIDTWTNAGTKSSTSPACAEFVPSGGGPIWLRIQFTSYDQLRFWYSIDGFFWTRVMKQGAGLGEAEDLTSGFFGADEPAAKAALDQVMLFYNKHGATGQSGAKFLHYSQDILEYDEINFPAGEPNYI
ncbi:MAG: hypothetical protein IRY99_18080, partial [Isosphaeraceae bacterium]|nr:hypothetical protein [Isosphaeraceae bacterium]